MTAIEWRRARAMNMLEPKACLGCGKCRIPIQLKCLSEAACHRKQEIRLFQNLTIVLIS